MNVRLNLATRPLESQRKFYVSAGLGAVLGSVLFLVLGWHVYSAMRTQENLRRKEQDNDRLATKLSASRKELDDFFARPENARLKDRVAFLNGFIDESSFNWTRMFVHLTVGAVSDEAKIKFLRAMESSPAFSNVTLLNVHEPSGGAGNSDQAVMELNAVYSRT